MAARGTRQWSCSANTDATCYFPEDQIIKGHHRDGSFRLLARVNETKLQFGVGAHRAVKLARPTQFERVAFAFGGKGHSNHIAQMELVRRLIRFRHKPYQFEGRGWVFRIMSDYETACLILELNTVQPSPRHARCAPAPRRSGQCQGRNTMRSRDDPITAA
jgi:hypothetical protein